MAKHRKAPRAGFIPYYIDDGILYAMFMKPSDPKFGGDKFQIAKGKIDAGENAEFAGKREACEELGLKLDNLETSEYLGTFLGYTELYYGRIMDKDDFNPFHYETGETMWMDVNIFAKVGRGLHIPIIKHFASVVANYESSLQNHLSET